MNIYNIFGNNNLADKVDDTNLADELRFDIGSATKRLNEFIPNYNNSYDYECKCNETKIEFPDDLLELSNELLELSETRITLIPSFQK